MDNVLTLSQPTLRRLIWEARQAVGNHSYLGLALAIGASEKSLYKWDSGTSKPDGDHLYRLLVVAGWVKVHQEGHP